jgi:HlyD family secretion protein
MPSSPAEVAPDSQVTSVAPEPPPQQSDNGPSPRGSRWLVPGIALAVLAVVLIAILVLGNRGKSPAAENSSWALSGAEHVLRLRGTTEAVQARSILAPLLSGQQVGTLTIVRLAASGSRVKVGDPLVEFDRQEQMRDFIDKQADYRKLVDQVAQEQAKEVAARAKDETELKQAEDALRKAELEEQKEELVSRIDAEKNRETLDEAKATYDQLRETFDLKRRAAQAAIKILEIQRDRTEQTMNHAHANADLMQIRSPIEGVVVLSTIWKQGTMGEVQNGDKIDAGTPCMQVVNPATMQVRVLANQEDFPRLRTGETAKVRLDAYPELVFPAQVEQLAPIGESGSFSDKVRQFAVIVSIQGNDPKLMPDLSAAVDVDLKGSGAADSATRSGS